MFNLGRLKHLADAIGVEQRRIETVLDDFEMNPSALVRELLLWRIDPTKKARKVIALRGDWRLIQRRIYTKLLLPEFRPTPYSHGGVKGRSVASNARVHVGNAHAFVTDIEGFFPSISCFRVNELFLRHACSYEVASALTRLCTYDYHLALGLMTSPIIANELFKPIDVHIGRACRSIDLSYGRFIDDVTISGRFSLADSGIKSTVRNIIGRHGFALAEDKTKCGTLDELSITGVRLKRDHLDVSRKFLAELNRLIADHTSLSQNGEFTGPLLTESELFGKAQFACTLNPGRRRMIMPLLQKIDWNAAMAHAVDRRLLRYRDRFTERGAERPDCSEPLALTAGAERYKKYAAANVIDPTVAPFGD